MVPYIQGCQRVTNLSCTNLKKLYEGGTTHNTRFYLLRYLYIKPGARSILSQGMQYCNWCIWIRGKQCLPQRIKNLKEVDNISEGLEESMCSSKGMEMRVGIQDGLSIEEEYVNTLRTRSNMRFLLNKQEYEEEMEDLLQPQQDLILPMLHKMMQEIKSTELGLAMTGYFDASTEASEICRQLLRNIKNTQSNYQSMDNFLASILGCTTATSSTPLALETFPVRSNPFSTTTRSKFRQIHDKYSSILQTIKSSHKKVAKKLKIMKVIKRLSRACLIIACGAVAIGITAHLLFFSLLVGSAVMGLCPFVLKRRITRLKRSKTKSLRQLQEQLDTVAKGTYVLGRDFDTVSDLVVRLSDGIERENTMAMYCMEMVDEKFPVQEMVMELRRSCSISKRLAGELEEHVGLCLATIYRARDLVIEEMSKQA